MSTTIYYFSATGNCLTTAKILLEYLGDCRLVPVASTKGMHRVVEQADTVGFVFPVYYGNMPWPVREMISKMVLKPDCYTFIFTTQRGHAGDVAKRADALLRTRGVKLSLAAGVKMPGNSFINEPEVDQAYLDAQRENIAATVQPLLAREVQDYFSAELMPQTPIDSANNFRGIVADENCTGCGTCAKVCPMNNIAMQDGRAIIGDACATCLACFHWCPQQAIWMSKQENIARRRKYRHPDVTLTDIIAQKHPEE